MQISVVATPATPAEQAACLVRSWTQAFGYPPSRALCELCLAQLCLENNNGKALWNDNPGNLTSTGADSFYVLSQLPTMKFRAFDTLQAGTDAYVACLSNHPKLVGAGISGSAFAFAQQINDSGYTPGINVPSVAHSLATMVAQNRSAHLLDGFDLSGMPSFLGAPTADRILAISSVLVSAGVATATLKWLI